MMIPSARMSGAVDGVGVAGVRNAGRGDDHVPGKGGPRVAHPRRHAEGNAGSSASHAFYRTAKAVLRSRYRPRERAMLARITTYRHCATMDTMTRPTNSPIEVPVWDWPVRAVHWAIALLVAALLTTGLLGNDALVWHMRFGETLLGLVLFRVIWGFVGSGNARFSSFVRGPGAVVTYVRSLFRPPHEVHATHNPIGGWMVIALLLAMLAQAGAGLFTQDDIGNEGPLVKLVSGDLSDSLGWFHRRGWWLVAGFASVHILAVIGYFLVLGDNLIWPMFTGRKRLPAGVASAKSAAASTTRAVILLAAMAAFVWWLVNRL